MDTITTSDNAGQGAERDRDVPRARNRRAALAGLGAAVGAALAAARAVAASAQESTTTAPPSAPSPADTALLAFAHSLELSASELYRVALAGPALGDENRLVFETFFDHHVQYGQALRGLVGAAAVNVPIGAVVSEGVAAFSSSREQEVLEAAASLEGTAAATHTALLAELVGTDGAGLVASIQPVEASQATALGRLTDQALREIAPPLQTDEGAVDPSSFTPSR